MGGKVLRGMVRLRRRVASRVRIALIQAQYPGVRIERSTIAPGCEITCSLGGTLTITGAYIGRDCTIHVDAGAAVDLRCDMNRGSMIVAKELIRIGKGTTLAAMVVVRDQDHRMPHALGEYDVDPIEIGEHVWVGTKASILRGSVIGDDATIGAHAVVKGEVESGSVYAGIPAKRIR